MSRRMVQGLIWFLLLGVILMFLFRGVESLIAHPVLALLRETPLILLFTV